MQRKEGRGGEREHSDWHEAINRQGNYAITYDERTNTSLHRARLSLFISRNENKKSEMKKKMRMQKFGQLEI